MFELFKKPLAETDLKHIWLYSFKNWGETQADYYMHQFDAGLQRLVDNPKLGRPRDSIRLGYHSIQINRHIAYYQIQNQRIVIVRVLHERMNPMEHLEGRIPTDNAQS